MSLGKGKGSVAKKAPSGEMPHSGEMRKVAKGEVKKHEKRMHHMKKAEHHMKESKHHHKKAEHHIKHAKKMK